MLCQEIVLRPRQLTVLDEKYMEKSLWNMPWMLDGKGRVSILKGFLPFVLGKHLLRQTNDIQAVLNELNNLKKLLP